MDKSGRGFIAWLVALFPRPKTPQWIVVEVEKPVPVLEHSDAAAIASLKGHPGIEALLNRLRLQQVAIEQQILSNRHEDLGDVNFLLSCVFGLRAAQSEIRSATKNQDNRRTRPASPDEIEQFEKIKSAIESVRPAQQ